MIYTYPTENPVLNISWYILRGSSPPTMKSLCYQFRSWITVVVELSTTLIYEHPGALQRYVCRTKFKQFVNSSSETLGSLVEESPIDTCHSPTVPRQQPTEVAHSRDLPAVEASRANPAVENSRDLPAVEDSRADLAVEDYVSRDLPVIIALSLIHI